MNSTNVTTSESTTAVPYSAAFGALVAVTYCLLVAVAFVLYAIVFVAMAKNRKDFSSPYYKYLVSIAVGECLYAGYYGVFGTVCQALSHCPVSMLANTIITAVISPGWPVEVATDVAIAFDRFVAICVYSKYATMFAGKTPFVIIGATWFYGIVVYQWPTISLVVPLYYDPGLVSLNSDSGEAALLSYAQMIADIVMLAVSAGFYLFTFAAMWKLRHKHAQSGTDNNNDDAQKRRRERVLVVQGFSHMLMVAFNDALYNGYVLPYNGSVAASFVSNVYLLIPVNNVVLLLICNSVVRENVALLFGAHRRGQPRASVAITTTATRARHGTVQQSNAVTAL